MMEKIVKPIRCRSLFVLCLLIPAFSLLAQSKLLPIDRSAIAGIRLPEGSKTDMRKISISSAKWLLEDVSRKHGLLVRKAEVISMNPVSANGFSYTWLKNTLADSGWQVQPIEGDSLYYWLIKHEKAFLIYLEHNKKETNLFVAELSGRPVLQPATKGIVQAADSSSAIGKAGSVETPGLAFEKMLGKYYYRQINFDDGWSANEEERWVRVTKGDVQVLIHHAQPDIRNFNNNDEAAAFVWNELLLPRYSQPTQQWVRKSFWSDGGFDAAKHYVEARVKDRESGKEFFVALYKGGNGLRWLEFICPDKARFEEVFTRVFAQDGTSWETLSRMQNYNRFALHVTDLPGTWASWSGANVQYVNIYTGLDAGMGHAQSGNQIQFNANNVYSREYKGVSGSTATGNRYYGEKNEGRFEVSKWELKLFNSTKGETHVFAAWFEAVKGGRVLHLYRQQIEEMHLFRLPK